MAVSAFSWMGRRSRISAGVMMAAMVTGMTGLGAAAAGPAHAVVTTGRSVTAAHSAKAGGVPARGANRASASAALPDPPESSSTAVSLVVNGVPAAGIPAFAGTYAVSNTGAAGGNHGGSVFPDPDGVLDYVSAATHTSVTSGNPPTPTWAGRSDIVAFSGPSLTAGGPHLVTIPELHNFAQCTPPHGLMTDSHVTRPVMVFGHELVDDGATVTADVTGTDLGLPDVQSGALTFTMRTISQRVGVVSAAIRFVITIDGTLTGRDGTELYTGPLATLTLADVTADCSTGPAKADVQVTKSGPATVQSDGTATYTLDVVNHGPGPAEDVTVQDPVSTDLADVSTSTSGCSVTGTPVTTLDCALGTMADGEVRQITITARVKPGVPPLTVIDNCGTVYTSTPETDTANNESCTETAVEIPPPAVQTDVEVVKTGPPTAAPGDTVTYTVIVTNRSTTAAHDVVLGDVLGSLGTLTGTLPAGCTQSGRTLTCAIGTLAPGDSRTFTVTATVAADAADGDALPNCAAVGTATRETDETNNESCVQTIVGTPPPPAAETDLAVAKSGPSTVPLGGHVTYLLTVTNNSTVDAHNVVISDVLGELVGIYGAPKICSMAGRVLTCDVGTLPAGASRTIALIAVPANGAAPGDSLENCEDAETTTPETSLAHNRSCAATLVTDTAEPPRADVTIDKSGPAAVKPGGSVGYTLTVANHSAAAATDVVVSDALADELGEITQVPAGCRLQDRTLTCSVGTLAPGTRRVFTVLAAARTDLVPGSVVDNCGEVYASTPDPATLASCVAATVKGRVIPVGPAQTGGGFAPAPAGSPLMPAGGLALMAAGTLLGAMGLRWRHGRVKA